MAENKHIKRLKLNGIKSNTFSSNLKKSIAYTVNDVTNDLMPFVFDLKTNNMDLVDSLKDATSSLSSSKSKLSNSSKSFINFGKETLSNAKSDLKEGIFNNKERTENNFLKQFGFDDDDFNFDFDDEDFEVESTDDNGNTYINNNNVKNIFTGNVNDDSEISTSIRQSALSQIKFSSSVASNQIQVMSSINDNIAKIVMFQKDSTQKHYEETARFYANTTELQREIKDSIIKLIPKPKELETQKESDFDKIIGSTGALDVKKYVDTIIKKNIPDALDDVFLGSFSLMKGMFSGNDGTSSGFSKFRDNPLGVITSSLIKTALPKYFKESLSDFNDTLRDTVRTFALQMNTYSKMDLFDVTDDFDDESSVKKGLKFLFGKMFKVDMGENKTSINTSRYEKGVVSFDGITRKAIIEVIPMYLRKILSTLQNTEDEIVYDYSEGKANWLSEIQRKFDAEKMASENLYLYESKYKVADYLSNNLGFENVYTKDFQNDLSTFFSALKDHKLPSINSQYDIEQFKNHVLSLTDIAGNTRLKDDRNLDMLIAATRNALNSKDLLKLAGHGIDGFQYSTNFMKRQEKNMEESGLSQVLSVKDLKLKNSLDYSNAVESDDFKRIVELERKNGIVNVNTHLLDIKKILLDGVNVYIKGSGKNRKLDEKEQKFYDSINEERESRNSIFWKFNNQKPDFGAFTDGFTYDEHIEELASDMLEKERFARNKNTVKFSNIIKKPFKTLTDGMETLTDRVAEVFYGTINDKENDLYETTDGKKLKFTDFIANSMNKMVNRLDEFIVKFKDWFNPKFDKFKKFLFGDKDENGNLSNGVFSNAGNMFRNAFRQGKHLLTGNKIKLTDGTFLEERENSLNSMIQNTFDVYKERFKNIFNDGTRRLSEGFENLSNTFFGKETDKGKIVNKFKDLAPNALFGGGLGLVSSLFLPGGPILNTLLGSALSMSAKSGHLETLLFGQTKDGQKLFGEKFKGILENEMVQKGLGKIGANLSIAKSGGIGYLAGMFLPGGPLLHGTIGTLFGINKKFGIIDNFLFGNETNSGIFGKKFSEEEKEAAKKFGIRGGALGLVGSMFLPGGPLLGVTLGSLSGIALKSKSLQELLFGKTKDGEESKLDVFKEKFSKLGIKGLKLSAGGILGSLFLPGGPILAPLMGMALSNKLLSEQFKTFLWGNYDPETGKGRIGQIPSLINTIKKSVAIPFKGFVRDSIEDIRHWTTKSIFIPMKYAFKPFMDLGKHLASKGQNIFKEHIFMPIADKIGTALEPVRKAFSQVAKFILSPFKMLGKFILSAPVKLFSTMSKAVERYNISHGIGDGYENHYKSRQEAIEAENKRHESRLNDNKIQSEKENAVSEAINNLQKVNIYKHDTEKYLVNKRNEFIRNYSEEELAQINSADEAIKNAKKGSGFLGTGLFRSGSEKDSIAEAYRNKNQLMNNIHNNRLNMYNELYAETDRENSTFALNKLSRVYQEIINSNGMLSYEDAVQKVNERDNQVKQIEETSSATKDTAENTKEISEDIKKMFNLVESIVGFLKGNSSPETTTTPIGSDLNKKIGVKLGKMDKTDEELQDEISSIKNKRSNVKTIRKTLKTKKGLKHYQDNLPQEDQHASGVMNYKGGISLVGEEGPEIVELPKGSNVIPVGRTKSVISSIADEMVASIKRPFQVMAAAITVPFKLAKDMISFVTSIPEKIKAFKDSVSNFFGGVANFGKKIFGFGRDNKDDFNEINAKKKEKQEAEEKKGLIDGFKGMFKDTRSMATSLLDSAKRGLKVGKMLFLALPLVMKVMKGIKDFMNGGLTGLLKNSIKPGGFLHGIGNNIASALISGVGGLLGGKGVGTVVKKTLKKVFKVGGVSVSKKVLQEGAEVVAKNAAKNAVKTGAKTVAKEGGEALGKSMLSKSFNKFLKLGPVKKVLGATGVKYLSKTGFKEILKKAGGKAIAKAGAGLMAAPLTAAFVASDLVSGFTGAKKILQIPKGGKITSGMRIAAGLGKALSNNLLFGLVPPKTVSSIVYKAFASEEKSNRLSELQSQFYNEASEAGMSTKKYNEEINSGFLTRFKNSLFGKKNEDGTYKKSGILNPWSWNKRNNELKVSGRGQIINIPKEMPSQNMLTNPSAMLKPIKIDTKHNFSIKEMFKTVMRVLQNSLKASVAVADALYNRKGTSLANIISNKVNMDLEYRDYQLKHDEKIPVISNSSNIYNTPVENTSVNNTESEVHVVKEKKENKALNFAKETSKKAFGVVKSGLGILTQGAIAGVMANPALGAILAGGGALSLGDIYKNGWDSLLGKQIKKLLMMPINLMKDMAFSLDKAILGDKNLTQNVIKPLITYAKNNYGLFLNKQEKIAWKALKEQNQLRKISLGDTFSANYTEEDLQSSLLNGNENLYNQAKYKEMIKHKSNREKDRKDYEELMAMKERGEKLSKRKRKRLKKISKNVEQDIFNENKRNRLKQEQTKFFNFKNPFTTSFNRETEMDENGVLQPLPKPKSNYHQQYYSKRKFAESHLAANSLEPVMIGEKPKSVLDKDREKVSQFINKQKGIIENATKENVSVIKENTDAVAEINKSIKSESEGYKAALKDGSSAISKMADNVIDATDYVVKDVEKRSIVDKVKESISNNKYYQQFSKKADSAKAYTKDKTSAFMNTPMMIKVKGKTSGMMNMISNNPLGQMVGGMASDALPSLLGKIPVIGPMIQSVPGLSGLISSAGPALTPLMSVLTPALPFLAAGGAIFALDKFGPKIEEFVDNLPDTLVNLVGKTIKFAFVKVPSIVMNAGKTLLRLVPKILLLPHNIMKTAFKKGFESVKNIGSNIWNAMKERISEVFSPITNFFHSIFEPVKKHAEFFASAIKHPVKFMKSLLFKKEPKDAGVKADEFTSVSNVNSLVQKDSVPVDDRHITLNTTNTNDSQITLSGQGRGRRRNVLSGRGLIKPMAKGALAATAAISTFMGGMSPMNVNATINKSLTNPIISSVAKGLEPIYGPASPVVAPAMVGLTLNANDRVLNILNKVKPSSSFEENVTMKQIKQQEEREAVKERKTIKEIFSGEGTFFSKITESITSIFSGDGFVSNMKSAFESAIEKFKDFFTGGNGSGRGIVSGRGGSVKLFSGRGFNNGYTYFNQNDPKWANQSLSNGDGDTVGSAGCGPTALAMALRSRGVDTDPSKAASFAQSYKVKNEGVSADYISDYAASSGVNLLGRTVDKYTTNDIDMSLASGQPVVALGKSSSGSTPYTSSGHYITISGKDSNGNYRVSDPLNASNNSKSFSAKDLLGNTSAYWTDGSIDGSVLDSGLMGMGSDYIRPVERSQAAKVTSYYGRRTLPDGTRDNHTGIDFGTQGKNSNVYAVKDGNVYFTKYEPRTGSAYGYGTNVRIKHGDGNRSLYAHLKEMYVKDGDSVKQGDIIGKVGKTGYSFGEHLHFELRNSNDKTFNPAPYVEHAKDPAGNGNYINDGIANTNTSGNSNGGSSTTNNTTSNTSNTSQSSKENDMATKTSNALGKLQDIFKTLIFNKFGIEAKSNDSGSNSDTSGDSTVPTGNIPAYSSNYNNTEWTSKTTGKRGDGPLIEMGAFFETGGADVGLISKGSGDYGGRSYGLPQFTTNSNGVYGEGSLRRYFMEKFMVANKTKYPNVWRALSPHTPYSESFNNAWRKLAKDHYSEFYDAQSQAATESYYNPLRSKLEAQGYDIAKQPKAIHSMILARGMQINNLLPKVLFPNAIKRLKVSMHEANNNPSALLRALYEEQLASTDTMFKSSSAATRRSLKNNRFSLGPKGEYAYANEILLREAKGEINRKDGNTLSKTAVNRVNTKKANLELGESGRGNKFSFSANQKRNELDSKAKSTTSNIFQVKNYEAPKIEIDKDREPSVTLNNYMSDTSSRINNALDIEFITQNLALNLERVASLLEDIKQSSRETAENTKVIAEKEDTSLQAILNKMEDNSVKTINTTDNSKTTVAKGGNNDFFMGNMGTSKSDPFSNLKTKVMNIARG